MSEKQSEIETVKALFGSKYFQRNCKVPFPSRKNRCSSVWIKVSFSSRIMFGEALGLCEKTND